MVAVCIALAVNKQVMYTSSCRGSIKGWVTGKLNCEDEFARLVCTSGEMFSYTVEPLVVTTSRKQPPLPSHRFSKIPNISKSNQYFWNIL